MCDFRQYVEEYLLTNNIDMYDINDSYMFVKDKCILYVKKDYTLFQDTCRIHTNFSIYDNVFLDDEECYDINTLLDLQITISNRLKYGYEFKLEFDDKNGCIHEQNYLSIIIKDEIDETVNYMDKDEIEKLMDKYTEIFESKKMIVLKFVD